MYNTVPDSLSYIGLVRLLQHLRVEKRLHGCGYFDLDGAYMAADKAESTDSAIVWSLVSFTETPRDPLYHLQFEVGARTANDAAQYESIKLSSAVQNIFSIGEFFYIQDYSQASDLAKLGVATISASGMAPAEFDQVSGIRPVQIVANVQRFT